MTAALRNINGSSSTRKILGTRWNGLLAEQIAAETATGDNGPGALYNEAINPAYAGKRLSMHVTAWPGVGTLRVEENGTVTASGFPDGVYVVPYDFKVESVFDSASSFTLTFGGNATATGGTGTGTGSGMGGNATGGSSATATGGTGTGTGSGTGGNAIGETGGSATATGGTGTGIGSGSGGDAAGEVVGEAWPLESDVRMGVMYGPTGTEFVGTMLSSGTSATADDIASAVVARLIAAQMPVNVAAVNGVTITGTGSPPDYWRPA